MDHLPASPFDGPAVRLLGAPALVTAGRVAPFPPERPFLLLALLACRRDWVRRDELADLLYPGRELESARSNLRKVIHLARKVDGVGEVEQRGDLLRWAPDSDLARFEHACDTRRHGDAIAAYGGPLLLGLDGAWPAAAAEWLDAERRRLQARWHEACLRHLETLAAEPAAASALAQRMLRVDPLDDTALLALGRARQAQGRTEEALAVVADYTRRLADELQMPPSAAVLRLQDDLRRAAPVAPPPAGPELIGRRHERAQARARLADPACRVLTLLGPPGVGKSALARALAAEQGAAWVPLEDTTRPDEPAHRIGQALGLTLDGTLPAWEALARALAGRAAWVALDGCEHLTLAAPLNALLAACPGLRLLAASQAALGVAGEWRLPVEGLPLPDADERDPEVLRANDAVRLFELRALPLAPGFDLAAEAADVVALVHEVDGLPLAIELLAAWRRLMPVRAIRTELADSLDVLEPTLPSERSVRASFARSWHQLGPAEQRVLAQLALLPGPCGRELLRGVLQAPLPVLAALVDRSLLRVDREGLCSLHPLIRRLASARAADGEALLERHARDVAHRLARAESPASDELPHLRAAWRWALERQDTALLDALRPPFGRLLTRLALWREGEASMQAGVALLRNLASPPARLAPMLAQLSAMLYQCGALDDALQTARDAEALGLAAGDPASAAWAARSAGAAHWQRGDLVAARAAFMRNLDHALALPDDAVRRASATAWIALVDKAEGRFDAAQSGYEEAVHLLRGAGRLHLHLYLLNNLGNLLRARGRTAEALAVLQEGLQLARQHGSLEDEPFLLTNIGLVHEHLGALETALQWAGRAVTAAAQHGEPMIEQSAHGLRARCTAALQRRLAPALPDLWASLAIADQLGTDASRASVLLDAGLVLALAGDRPAGFALVRHAQASPATNEADRDEAERRLRRFAPTVGELAQAAALLATDAPAEEALALLRRAAEADAARA